MAELSTNKFNILLSAAQVAVQHGAAHLTLDRVAKVAKLSKGGLLYHYPTKRALLEGMLLYLQEQIESSIEQNQLALAEQPRAQAQAVILAASELDEPERIMAQALLAAAAEDPKLLAPARSTLRNLLTDASAEDDQSLILLLAVEGIRFLSLLDLLPDQNPSRDDLYKLLLHNARHAEL